MNIGKKITGLVKDHNEVVSLLNKLRNIDFCKTQFTVTSDATGLHISLIPSTSGGLDYYPFRVWANTSNSNETAINISAGSWVRKSNDILKYNKLETTNGNSENYIEDFAYINTINTGDNFIYLILNDAKDPIRLTANVYNSEIETEISKDKNTVNYKKIAKVYKYLNPNNAYSLDIEQYWQGGNIQDQFNIYDSESSSMRSIGFNSNNEVEIYGFNTYTDVDNHTCGTTDVALLRVGNTSDAEIKYTKIYPLTVITNIQYNTNTHALEKQTADIYCLAGNTNSDWEEITVAALCESSNT